MQTNKYSCLLTGIKKKAEKFICFLTKIFVTLQSQKEFEASARINRESGGKPELYP